MVRWECPPCKRYRQVYCSRLLVVCEACRSACLCVCLSTCLPVCLPVYHPSTVSRLFGWLGGLLIWDSSLAGTESASMAACGQHGWLVGRSASWFGGWHGWRGWRRGVYAVSILISSVVHAIHPKKPKKESKQQPGKKGVIMERHSRTSPGTCLHAAKIRNTEFMLPISWQIPHAGRYLHGRRIYLT